jgi:predicted metal-dependent hydrolase
MKDTLQIGALTIEVTRKAIRNVHLSVHPPDGRITLSAPLDTRLEVARAYAISRLSWIHQQQEKMAQQPREAARELVTRESHSLWGRRYLLEVVPTAGRQQVVPGHRRITLRVRPDATHAQRAQVFYAWQKQQLHRFAMDMIAKWEPRLGVKARAYYLQRMKTKWGSCNHRAGTIRLNTELVKKPKDLVEYVIVHELAHLLVPVHNAQFIALLDRHYPPWREARKELNDLPLGHVAWKV